MSVLLGSKEPQEHGVCNAAKPAEQMAVTAHLKAKTPMPVCYQLRLQWIALFSLTCSLPLYSNSTPRPFKLKGSARGASHVVLAHAAHGHWQQVSLYTGLQGQAPAAPAAAAGRCPPWRAWIHALRLLPLPCRGLRHSMPTLNHACSCTSSRPGPCPGLAKGLGSRKYCYPLPAVSASTL